MSSSNEAASGHPLQLPEPTKVGKIPFVPPRTELQCETSYTIWGDLNASVTPLICLHGGPGCPSQYMTPFSLIHQRYGIPVILYDQIGCGKSTRLPDKMGDTDFWTFELFLAELKNLISSFGITQHDIFGHSWGGMIASKYALTQPENMRKLVIAGSPALLKTRMRATAEQRAKLPADMADAFVKYEKSGDLQNPEYKRAMNEFTKRHFCRLDPMPQDFVDAATSWVQDDTVKGTLYGDSSVALTGPMKDFDVVEELRTITDATAPGGVLLINGKYDTAPDNVMQPFFTNIRARVKWIRFAESSHMAFWEENEAFTTALGDFLSIP